MQHVLSGLQLKSTADITQREEATSGVTLPLSCCQNPSTAVGSLLLRWPPVSVRHVNSTLSSLCYYLCSSPSPRQPVRHSRFMHSYSNRKHLNVSFSSFSL